VVFFTAMVFLLAGIMIADIWLLVWWLSWTTTCGCWRSSSPGCCCCSCRWLRWSRCCR